MADRCTGQVAIVDYGTGNLYSIKLACEYVGLRAAITSSGNEIQCASAVILPGVGAFGGAMETLRRLDLVAPLRDIAASQTPLVGICLGMQLLMGESYEFGRHKGLGIIEGEVVPLEPAVDVRSRFKVPQIGWNRIYTARRGTLERRAASDEAAWKGSLLEGCPEGEFMYFVHSFYCKPTDASVVLSTTQYGPSEFCSSLSRRNIFACQFHPERSALPGLQVYQNLARTINTSIAEEHNVTEVGSQIRFA